MQKTTCLVGLCAALLVGATDAQAQMRQWEDGGYVGFSLGGQLQSRTFTETSAPLINGENASITLPHTIGSRPVIDASGVVRVWRNGGIGVGFSRLSASEAETTISAQIPNPIVFGSPRSASVQTGELSHTESVVHVQLLWMMPMSARLQVAAILGPSFFIVKRDLISGVTTTEGAPPFGTVTITAVQTEERSKTAVALTIGTDVAYFVTRRIGAGGFVRFSRLSGGNADLPAGGGEGEVSVDAGGLQVGGGLRVRF